MHDNVKMTKLYNCHTYIEGPAQSFAGSLAVGPVSVSFCEPRTLRAQPSALLWISISASISYWMKTLMTTGVVTNLMTGGSQFRNLTYFAAEIQVLIELAYLISYLSTLFIRAI
ncbi:hypothetical protein STEG23_020128 [Scotinomys teguina]